MIHSFTDPRVILLTVMAMNRAACRHERDTRRASEIDRTIVQELDFILNKEKGNGYFNNNEEGDENEVEFHFYENSRPCLCVHK